MKDSKIVNKTFTLHDDIYRLKNNSVREIVNHYPDKVTEMTSENGKTVLVLDNMRIKYEDSAV